MRLTDVIGSPLLTLSFEVFPPKTDARLESVKQATEEIAALHPAYVSVTYGAGGRGSRYTLEIAMNLQAAGLTETLPHLTCVDATAEDVRQYLAALRRAGMSSVMALRGDLPADMTPRMMGEAPYPHASDLIRAIKAEGDFCIGAACYPEVHPESAHQRDDIAWLKEKVDAGADFLTTQMFFSNELLYNFLYKLREAGIMVPVVPGIMPITSAKQIERALKLSGSFMPRRFTALVDRFGSSDEAMQQAGIIYATDQIIDLYANGIRHVHVYTMNKPEVARAIQRNLSAVLGRDFG